MTTIPMRLSRAVRHLVASCRAINGDALVRHAFVASVVLSVLAMGASLTMVGATEQNADATNITGRWTLAARGLTLDISRCGEGWCGVEVRDEACGATVLRVSPQEGAEERPYFVGRLDFEDPAKRYAVHVARIETQTLQILGDTGPGPYFVRRSLPLVARLSRTGPATCRAAPVS